MFLKSSELITIADKKYLQIFLNKEYFYKTTENGEEVDRYEILLEEPNALDARDLQKTSIILERFFNYKISQEFKEYAALSEQELDLIEERRQKRELEIPLEKTEEPTEQERIDARKQMLAIVFSMCKTMRNDNLLMDEMDYYLELAKLFHIINKKSRRPVDEDLLVNTTLDVFDVYKGKSYGIKEEILIEYISFFLDHFPSNSILRTLE